MVTQHKIEWVLLNYQLPREPSTPRIAVWRQLKALGVAQLGDGLVALPHNPKTREALEWVSQRVHDANGTAVVWMATPGMRTDGEALAQQLRNDRDTEYTSLLSEIANASPSNGADTRTINRWRRELRKIERRDWFGVASGDQVRAALADLNPTKESVTTP